jgi:hypothetical protein
LSSLRLTQRSLWPRLVYACRFEVPSADGASPLLAVYRDWIENHYRNRRGLKAFEYTLDAGAVPSGLPPEHTLNTERFVSGSAEVIQIEWAYPAERDPTLRWRNEVRIGSFEVACNVEHLIWIESIDYTVSPAQIVLGSPSVIRQLCSKTTVRIGDMEVKGTHYTLRSDGIASFFELLSSPLRRIPIIFVSAYADRRENPIDVSAMAARLAAVGIVISAEEGVTWEIEDALGRALSCFNGGVRIYWPGFTARDDPRRHPLYLGTRIGNSGPEYITRVIERLVFGVASFRFVPDPRIAQVVRAAKRAERAKHIEVQKLSPETDWEA